MTRFPLTSSPLPFESLDSWLEYLAGLLNCSVRIILRESGIDTTVRAGFTNSVNDDFAAKLAAATGATPDAIHSATLHRYPSLISNGIVHPRLASGTTAGYCPDCLAESGGRWHLKWHAKTTMVCTIHNVVLLQHCPTCGSRPRLSPTRTAQPIKGGPLRSGPCGPHGCLPSLTSAHAPQVTPDGLIAAGQRWIDSLLSIDTVELPSRPGFTAPAAGLLSDITSLKSLQIPLIGPPNDEDRPRDHNVAQVLNEIDRESLESDRLSHLIVQTLFAAAYTTTNARQAANFFSFMPTEAGQRRFYHRPLSDDRRPTTTRTTRHLFYRHEFANVRTDRPSWHRDVLATLPVAPLSPAHLPSRIWPEVVKHHPEVPDAVRRLVPLTAVISLSAMGASLPPAALRRHFDIVMVHYQIDIELQTLWACTNREQILDYYLDLHATLSSSPPIIDYSRRRALFPTPASIPTEPGTSPQERRFTWQLLTGSDPFASTGSRGQFGPVVAMYLRYVQQLRPETADRLHDIATTILRKTGIDNEPLLYTPISRSAGFGELSDRTDEFNWKQAIHPGAHVVDLASAEEHRTPAAVVNYALTSDNSVARLLLNFLSIADQPTTIAAAAHLGRANPGQYKSDARLELLLGRAVYTRARANNPRAITRAGRALRDLCEARRSELERAAGLTPVPQPPPTNRDRESEVGAAASQPPREQRSSARGCAE